MWPELFDLNLTSGKINKHAESFILMASNEGSGFLAVVFIYFYF